MGQIQIAGEQLPIFSGAGVGKDEEALGSLVGTPLVAVVIGSFTEHPWTGNSQGGRYTVEHWDQAGGAYYNSIGLQNLGRVAVSEYLPKLIQTFQRAGQLAIVSVTTLKGENPAEVLPSLVAWGLEMGADAVEINGSCPNQSPDHPLLCADVDASRATIAAVRDHVGPEPYLIYKVSPLTAETIKRYRAEGLDVNAIDTTNTLGNQQSPTNPATGEPFIEVNGGLAGMSGPAIRDLSTENLRMWLGLDEADGATGARQFDVWSLGGVDNGAEAYHRHQLGALLVGGVQAFRRASDRAQVAHEWAGQYAAAQSADQ